MPEGSETGILKGMYRFRQGGAGSGPRVQLLGSGAILREVIAAADLLRNDWGVEADIWSCPSFTQLARDGNECARWSLLHPTKPPRLSHVGECLKDTRGPVIASTDYVRAFAEQIRPFVPRRYTVLGTDGFGRSDTREKLRYFFEVDRHWVTLASLAALAEDGAIERQKVADAIKKYGIDPEKPNPLMV
jgi:pyruvate dehydrogenase E1 component